MSVNRGISVVIPNYNGLALLPQVLPTVLLALQRVAIPSEIIVSDDCSTDGSPGMLRQNFPQVKLVSNAVNSGFSVTANNGVRSAQYDWVLLLNSDVKLEPDYFNTLLRYMDDSAVFGVMGRIIGWEDEEIQDGAKYPYFHGVKIKTSGNYLLQNEAEMSNGIPSMYVSGANMFVNRSRYLAIGGLNELFSPYYVEDFELSLRAWRLGYQCIYDHFAVCRHRTSSTIASSSRKKQVRKIYNRNKMYLHAIHLEQPKRFLWFLQLFPEALGYFVLGRWTYLRSLFLFLGNYAKVKESRRQLYALKPKGSLLSLQQVADRILDSTKGKAIRRF